MLNTSLTGRYGEDAKLDHWDDFGERRLGFHHLAQAHVTCLDADQFDQDSAERRVAELHSSRKYAVAILQKVFGDFTVGFILQALL